MTLPAFFRFSRKERIASFLILAVLTAISVMKQFRRPPERGDAEESLALALFKRSVTSEDSVADFSLSGEPGAGWLTNDSSFYTERRFDDRGKFEKENANFRPKGYFGGEDTSGSTGKREQEREKNWRKEWEVVELNSCDSAALEALPGIGPGSAAAIIRYRARLGGFRSVNQLSEIKALRSENLQTALPYLYADTSRLNRFCLNTCTAEELRRHPYISYKVANAIAAVREQHGNYRSVAEIKKSVLVNDSIYERIYNYFSLCHPDD